MSFVRFVLDETWPTVKACLEAAFGYFGGVPRELLFDNMKTVVLERNAYGRGRHRLHPGLLALSRDLGFAVRLCRPYRAKTKGKVERFNRYLRESFYNPLVTRLQADVVLDDVSFCLANLIEFDVKVKWAHLWWQRFFVKDVIWSCQT